jgi:hypothetical protein
VGPVVGRYKAGKTSASSDARNVVLFATATKGLRECDVRKEVSTGWRRQFLFLSSCGLLVSLLSPVREDRDVEKE